MRVLHLTSSYPRRDGDPNAPYLAELVRAQAAVGLEPLVVAPHGPGLERETEIGGVPVHRFAYAPEPAEVIAYRGSVMSAVSRPLGAAALPAFMAAFAAAARREARGWRADVVHAHWWMPAGVAAVAAGAGASGTPLVVTCHGTDVQIARRVGVRRAAGAVLRRAAVVAAVSEALARDVAATVPGTDPIVLRMPFRPSTRDVVSPRPNQWTGEIEVLAVGRVFPEKGFDVAVAAVGALAARSRRVRLRIMGDGGAAADLRRRTEDAGVADLVEFVPSGSREEMFTAIDASDAVVIPSRWEGLGLVALDAISRGRPVIASAVGGLVETLLGPARIPRGEIVETPLGLLVPPTDVVAWAAALERLPLWPAEQMDNLATSDAAARVLGRHDADRVAKEHAAAYETALASKRSA